MLFKTLLESLILEAKKGKKKKYWIPKDLKKGALRKLAAAEGAIKDDGTIDVNWLKRKAKSPDKTVARRARLALTFRRMRKR